MIPSIFFFSISFVGLFFCFFWLLHGGDKFEKLIGIILSFLVFIGCASVGIIVLDDYIVDQKLNGNFCGSDGKAYIHTRNTITYVTHNPFSDKKCAETYDFSNTINDSSKLLLCKDSPTRQDITAVLVSFNNGYVLSNIISGEYCLPYLKMGLEKNRQ